MSFDLKNLEVFVRAATIGAIGRAGEELGLSSTNASERLRSLEKDLGANLVNRTTRSLSLTADGERFLEHAKGILESVEVARASMSDDDEISGILRVTASASMARSHLTPFVPEFVEKYPHIRLDIHLSDGVVDIVDRGFDIAFRIGDLPPSTLLARKVDDNPVILVASPDYLKRHGAPDTPEELARHKCIPLGRTAAWKLRSPEQKTVVAPISGPITVNHGNAIADWVLAGLGIGQASLWHAGPDLRAGRLIPILSDYRVLPEMQIWAVRPPSRIMPRRVHIFLEHMQVKVRETNRQRYGDLLDKLF